MRGRPVSRPRNTHKERLFDMKTTNFSFAVLAAVSLMASVPASAQFGAARYRVEITNLTKGQILSPAVVATHSDAAPRLYTLGAPASAELAQVAEDAVLDPLVTMLSEQADVLDVQVMMGEAGPIMPGETASVEVEALGQFNRVSMVSMLVTTNDSFVGISNVRGPNLGTGLHMAPAYDAGSEANTEMCAHIPGPPCGNPMMRVTDGAEGYVYVSPGITGAGDVEVTEHTWLNPVARISITRL